jgi:hypothetical protein
VQNAIDGLGKLYASRHETGACVSERVCGCGSA